MLSPQEYREQADQCIGWVRAAVSDSERKLFPTIGRVLARKRPSTGAPRNRAARRRRGSSPGDQSHHEATQARLGATQLTPRLYAQQRGRRRVSLARRRHDDGEGSRNPASRVYFAVK